MVFDFQGFKWYIKICHARYVLEKYWYPSWKLNPPWIKMKRKYNCSEVSKCKSTWSVTLGTITMTRYTYRSQASSAQYLLLKKRQLCCSQRVLMIRCEKCWEILMATTRDGEKMAGCLGGIETGSCSWGFTKATGSRLKHISYNCMSDWYASSQPQLHSYHS